MSPRNDRMSTPAGELVCTAYEMSNSAPVTVCVRARVLLLRKKKMRLCLQSQIKAVYSIRAQAHQCCFPSSY